MAQFKVRSNFYGKLSHEQVIGSWHVIEADDEAHARRIFKKGSNFKDSEIDVVRMDQDRTDLGHGGPLIGDVTDGVHL